MITSLDADSEIVAGADDVILHLAASGRDDSYVCALMDASNLDYITGSGDALAEPTTHRVKLHIGQFTNHNVLHGLRIARESLKNNAAPLAKYAHCIA